jgi:hypothetical protein
VLRMSDQPIASVCWYARPAPYSRDQTADQAWTLTVLNFYSHFSIIYNLALLFSYIFSTLKHLQQLPKDNSYTLISFSSYFVMYDVLRCVALGFGVFCFTCFVVRSLCIFSFACQNCVRLGNLCSSYGFFPCT